MSIRISTNGLSFCIYSPLTNQQFVYKDYDVQPTISMAANLKNALMSEPMLNGDYQRVNVMITSPHTTFVPAADFNAADIDDIYAFNFPQDTNLRISYNMLRRSGIAIIFGINKNIYQLLIDDYPKARFYASSSTLIERFSAKSITDAHKQMFAYLHEREMTIYSFQSGRLLMSNTYDTRTVDDCMYYILNLSQHLPFSQTEDTLYIVGETGHEQQLALQLQNFIRNIHVIDRKTDLQSTVTGGNTLIPYDLQTLLIIT